MSSAEKRDDFDAITTDSICYKEGRWDEHKFSRSRDVARTAHLWLVVQQLHP
jgi:hypothetical protein